MPKSIHPVETKPKRLLACSVKILDHTEWRTVQKSWKPPRFVAAKQNSSLHSYRFEHGPSSNQSPVLDFCFRKSPKHSLRCKFPGCLPSLSDISNHSAFVHLTKSGQEKSGRKRKCSLIYSSLIPLPILFFPVRGTKSHCAWGKEQGTVCNVTPAPLCDIYWLDLDGCEETTERQDSRQNKSQSNGVKKKKKEEEPLWSPYGIISKDSHLN